MTQLVDHAIVDVLVARDNLFLLVEEGKSGREGKYSTPGGHVEPDETLFEAAIREVKEESGYAVALIGLVGIYQSIYSSVNVSGPVFVAKVVGGEAISSEEHPLSIWATLEDIEKLDQEDRLFGPHILPAAKRYLQGGMVSLDVVICIDRRK